MKTIIVKAVKKTNWAGETYIDYETKEFGKIAELDLACDERGTRVYDFKGIIEGGDYLCFSCDKNGKVGAEALCGGYLAGLGYRAKFAYAEL